MAKDQPPSAIGRRQARTYLKNLRMRKELTQQQVAEAFGWSAAKVMRIENGKTPVTVSDVTALLTFYEVTDRNEIARLQDLVRGNSPKLAKTYRDWLPPAFAEFLEFEESAHSLRSYETMLVPGPLQTEDYARAALTLYVEAGAEKNVERRVELRMERGQMLRQEGAPTATFIIDEAVLQRQVGAEMGRSVMEGQLRHLQAMSDLPNVSIQVMPFAVGLYSKYRVPFVILELDDEANPRLVYLETHTLDIVLYDNTGAVEPYVDTFSRMQDLGTEPGRFRDIVDGVLKGRVRDLRS